MKAKAHEALVGALHPLTFQAPPKTKQTAVTFGVSLEEVAALALCAPPNRTCIGRKCVLQWELRSWAAACQFWDWGLLTPGLLCQKHAMGDSIVHTRAQATDEMPIRCVLLHLHMLHTISLHYTLPFLTCMCCRLCFEVVQGALKVMKAFFFVAKPQEETSRSGEIKWLYAAGKTRTHFKPVSTPLRRCGCY